MPEIVLTEEQANVLAASTTAVFIRAPDGATAGSIDPHEAEIIAEAKRRLAKSTGVIYTSDQIQAQLHALNTERERIGPFDEKYMWSFLSELDRTDPEKYGPKRRE